MSVSDISALSKPFRFWRVRRHWIALAAAAAWPAVARAQTDNWIAGDGNWSAAANWSDGVPGYYSSVNFTDSDGISRTLTYDYIGQPVTLNSLTIDLVGGGVNTLAMSANDLTATHENIGQDGAGSFTQSGGTNTVFDFYVGAGPESTGSYLLSGTGVLTSTDYENVGSYNYDGETNGGTGTFVQSGGTNSSPRLYVGEGGAGTYTQTGGTNTINRSNTGSALLSVGLGSYALSGAALLTVSGGYEGVGIGTAGSFLQNGGTNTIASGGPVTLALGESNGISTYTLNAGNLNALSAEVVGEFSEGVFVQTGGTNTMASLDVGGFNTPADGVFYLSGGSLSVINGEEAGQTTSTNSGLMQTDGANTAASLYVGGFYDLFAGSLAVSGTETVGFLNGPVPATFLQTGGTNTIGTAGELVIAGVNRGNYTISGGTLSVPGGIIIKAGTLAITGGFVTAGSLIDGVIATFTTTGNSLSIGYGGSLAVTGQYLQAPKNLLSIDIQSLSEFGQFQVDGALNLAGTLQLLCDSTYTPEFGDTLPIILDDSGINVSGTFSTVTTSTVNSGGYFVAEYDPPDNPSGVDVVFIPEPTGLALVMATSLLLTRRQRAGR
jgi:hypothetical protein